MESATMRSDGTAVRGYRAVVIAVVAVAVVWAGMTEGGRAQSRAGTATRTKRSTGTKTSTPATNAALASIPTTTAPAEARRDEAGKALIAIVDADPLELARVVQRFGDAAILRLLAPTTAFVTRLAAVRASPWLLAPERALGALSELAAGRDPDLAPAAARAALEIAQQLDPASLARRECAPIELRDALARLQAIGARDTVAPHVRADAWAAAEQLIAAGVSPPASKP
jgi:hypothetical protein